MSKKLIIILGVVVGSLILGWSFISYVNNTYDRAVYYQETVDENFANVKADYQRRADLIPGLIETVKGAAENEKEILTTVTQARAGIVNAKTPGDLEMFGRQINTAINLAYEAYPEIKSTANFSDFQAQLEGTENRINVSRKRYNESVKAYNLHIRGKFRKAALNFWGDEEEFPKAEGFELITEGAENAPAVKF